MSMHTETVLLPTLLKRCGQLVDQHMDSHLKQYGIARSQYRVLYHVHTHGEVAQRELLDILEVQGATLTPILDVLVQKGWLTRTPVTSNRRINMLALTEEGIERLTEIPSPSEELQTILEKELGITDSKKLETLLKHVITHLSERGR